MTKVIINILFLFSVLVFSSCLKDTEEFIPNGTGKIVNARIFGVVVDENNEAVDGAIISFKGKTVKTDQYGVFKYNDALVDSRHNFLNVSKDGYFQGTRTFRANHSKTIYLKTQLIKKNFSQSFDSSLGGKVQEGSTELTFSSNSLVSVATKSDYNGIVKVAMKYLDPTIYNTNESMPGDLSALNIQNEMGTLNSFGMVYVELESPTGEKLQLKSGKTAELSSMIPSIVADEAPSEIAMWYFDNGLGLWKEEGKATKINGRYVANVSHFTCWNYDYYSPSIILSGRIVDQNGNPLTNVHVWVSKTGEYLGGHGNTDNDGTFSGRVPKDVLLDLKVYALGSGCGFTDPVLIKQIGPFSVDTDLGDVVVTILADQYCNVTGTFTDCNGNLIIDGFAKIDDHYFEITDGTLAASVIACNSNNKKITVTDRALAKTIAPIDLVSPGNNNLGTINVCQLDADFFRINCDALAINFTLADSISIKSMEQRKLIHGSGLDNTKFGWIYFSYKDPDNIGKCAIGTYDVANSEGFYFSETGNQNNGKHFSLVSGSVNITQGGNIGDRIKGDFTLVMKESVSGLNYDFYGSFQLLLE